MAEGDQVIYPVIKEPELSTYGVTSKGGKLLRDSLHYEYNFNRVSGDRKWIKRASLVDSKNEVTDVQFSPKHLGLCLATCSRDGMIRIYEAFDVMKLSMWPMQVGSF